MDDPTFQPGFRLSKTDIAVLIIGAVATFVLWPKILWLAFVIAFSVGHFFLFCNIFRLSRPLELLWSVIFIILVFGTVSFGIPTWQVTISSCLAVTAFLIGIEMRKPSYHGILWRYINPNLPNWWSSQTRIPS